MFVVVNRGADSGVVLVPFVSLDSTIAVSVAEVLEEFKEDLILGLLTALDFRVHAAVVDASEVGGGDLTTAIGIELKEGLVDHSLSLGVEGALKTVMVRSLRTLCGSNKEYLHGYRRGTHRS